MIAIFTVGTMVVFVLDGIEIRAKELKEQPPGYEYPMPEDCLVTVYAAASFSVLELFRPCVFKMIEDYIQNT